MIRNIIRILITMKVARLSVRNNEEEIAEIAALRSLLDKEFEHWTHLGWVKLWDSMLGLDRKE